MKMYGVNNNSSSSSTSSMEEDKFIQIKDLVSQYRIDQDMKNDGNDQYYTIMSQNISTEFAGDAVSPKTNDNNIVIEDDDDVNNSIISQNNNNDISLEHTNVFEKELDINSPLFDNILKKKKNKIYYI
jgi:hypothetical protein